MFTGVHHLDRSHRWPISSTVRNTGEELFLIWTVRLLIKPWLNYALLRLNNVWRCQQNFEKRNNNVTKVYQNNCCTLWLGSMGFVHPRWQMVPSVANGTLGFALGAISPLGCTKRHAACNNCILVMQLSVGNYYWLLCHLKNKLTICFKHYRCRSSQYYALKKHNQWHTCTIRQYHAECAVKDQVDIRYFIHTLRYTLRDLPYNGKTALTTVIFTLVWRLSVSSLIIYWDS